VIGFVGWIEPRKGPSDLVHAAPAIRRGAPGARIVIVGNPPPFDPSYGARVLASREVEHYPWTPNAPGLMRHMDVLVLPSYIANLEGIDPCHGVLLTGVGASDRSQQAQGG
jgi:glycosyltransferase involved in cell wall biosynthesis